MGKSERSCDRNSLVQRNFAAMRSNICQKRIGERGVKHTISTFVFLFSTNGFELPMKHFTKDTSGSVTIEFVLWVPIIFFFLLLATDSSLAFMRQSQMWQVSRETARIVSRYGMDEATAEAYASSRAVFGTTAATADVTFGSGDVQVSMSVPFGVLAPFGTLNLVMADTFTTRVSHAMEPL